MMVGREMKPRADRSSAARGAEVLRVEALSLAHPDRPGDFLLRDIDLTAYRGEVLGIFGLMGAGRTELLETIFGLHPRTSSGGFFVNGQRATHHFTG